MTNERPNLRESVLMCEMHDFAAMPVGLEHCRSILARLDAADPIRAMLPEVVEAWETFEEQYVHEFGEHRVKGDHLDRTFQRLSGILTKLRALTATEGGTDDGE